MAGCGRGGGRVGHAHESKGRRDGDRGPLREMEWKGERQKTEGRESTRD